MGPAEQQRVDWVGDNAAAVRVTAVPVSTQVKLLPEPVGTSVTAMGAVAPGTEVARLYLALHSVRGKAPSPVLDVYVNLPDGVDPQLHPENRAGRVTLFGLNVASDPDGAHAGNGLGLTLDITDLAQRLIAAGNFDLESLRVTLVPLKQISEASPVTVEKIGLIKRIGVVT
jgi:tyrosinase